MPPPPPEPSFPSTSTLVMPPFFPAATTPAPAPIPPPASVGGLADFLASCGLAHHLDMLRREDIDDVDTLRLLDSDDLRDVGFPVGARRKLLHALGKA